MKHSFSLPSTFLSSFELYCIHGFEFSFQHRFCNSIGSFNLRFLKLSRESIQIQALNSLKTLVWMSSRSVDHAAFHLRTNQMRKLQQACAGLLCNDLSTHTHVVHEPLPFRYHIRLKEVCQSTHSPAVFIVFKWQCIVQAAGSPRPVAH